MPESAQQEININPAEVQETDLSLNQNIIDNNNLPLTVITPPKGWISINFHELWKYRDLLSLLIWRDISARYRQSIVGYSWALIKPVMSMIIFTAIFSYFAKISAGDGIPYPVFAFAGLLPWLYFSTALSASTGSIVGGSALLQKVYFPRLILPISAVVVGLVDFAIQLVVLFALMLFFKMPPPPQIVLFPVFAFLAMLTALSVGLWLTALNVKYRDVSMAVPFLIQIWMYCCPIIYPVSMVPERFRTFYALNPMVGVIEGFRWSILGISDPNWVMMGISFTVVLVLLFSGMFYFRKVETTFADII